MSGSLEHLCSIATAPRNIKMDQKESPFVPIPIAMAGGHIHPTTIYKVLLANLVSSLQDLRNNKATIIQSFSKSIEGNSPDSKLSDSKILESGNTNLIINLNQNNSKFINSLLSLKPSDITKFECSNALSSSTLLHTSMVNSKL